jgi:hypothetical protein
MSSYSHLPPATLKYIAKRPQEQHEAKVSRRKTQKQHPKIVTKITEQNPFASCENLQKCAQLRRHNRGRGTKP